MPDFRGEEYFGGDQFGLAVGMPDRYDSGRKNVFGYAGSAGGCGVINILAGVVLNFYEYCIKPKSDLKMRQYLEEYLMAHTEKLSLGHYENSEFYTTVTDAAEREV